MVIKSHEQAKCQPKANGNKTLAKSKRQAKRKRITANSVMQHSS